MQRILIADGSLVLTEALERELQRDYLVQVCYDGGTAVDLLAKFEPDILVLDTMITEYDAVSILRMMRTSGNDAKVILLTRYPALDIIAQAQELGVSHILPKPCALGAIVACIRDISFRLMIPEGEQWCVENETDNILLRLGFGMGYSNYSCVYHGVLIKYQVMDSSATKYIYPEVAKICGGSGDRIEKAIRDGIKKAWLTGDRRVWQLYFPPGRDGVMQCPSNEAFLSRIAGCLRQRTRIKKPYELQKYIAK